MAHDLRLSGEQMFEEYGIFGDEYSSERVDATWPLVLQEIVA